MNSSYQNLRICWENLIVIIMERCQFQMIILFLILLFTSRRNYILMAVAVVVELPPCFWNGNGEWKQRAEDFVGKLSWRKYSSDSTLFFILVYDIHKHVGNVVLWGISKKILLTGRWGRNMLCTLRVEIRSYRIWNIW